MNNWKDKKDAYKRVLGLFRASYGEGVIKLSNETIEHFTVKCQVAHFYKKNGYKVWCEPVMRGCRPDLLVLHSNGDAYIVEILKSETEKRFNKKLDVYPLPIRKVYVKEFDYNTFGI